ncbi:MAG: hypothetical protein H6Q07_2931 [Acidobacteria bacterium]|nr:hypothetical protein [Acidobacteriota bacterium]
MMRSILCLLSVGTFALFCAQQTHASGPPFKFTLNEGKTSVSLGFLAQPQFESLENATGTDSAENLFFRRIRFIAGGKITSKLSFFAESDNPNMGKKAANGERINEFFLQDAYLSYAFRPEFQLDGGMIIVPVSHNTAQSAATLLPVDFGTYCFMASEPTRSKTGRDYGVQARGYINKHFEYRFGVFRGNTDLDSDFPFRYTARFVWYPLEAETGFFYTGTTHGQKKIVALGASFDRQGNYSANSLDFFFDHPVKNGDAITIQADFIRYDGGTSFQTLPRQNDWLLEGSYYFRKVRLGPYAQFTSRDFIDPGSSDDSRVQGGIAYWIQKHRLNIKAGYGKLRKDHSPDRSQFVVQAQFFYY